MDKVTTKQDLLDRLREHAPTIHAYGVRRIGLFGSFVRNEARDNSDVDLFVEFDPARKNLKNLVGLSRSLQALLGRKVELITPESLNRSLGKYILQEVEYVTLAA
jgi:uncharacterized protein